MKRSITLILLLFAGSIILKASVSPDATTTFGSNQTAELSWSHPTGAGASLLLLSVTTLNQPTVSATYNGIPLAMGASVSQNGVFTAVYFMVSPSEGQHQLIIHSAAPTEIYAGAETFFGTDLNQPFGAFKTNKGYGNKAFVSVSSGIGSLVFQSIGAKNAYLQTWGSDQHQLHNVRGLEMANYTSLKTGTATTPMTGYLNTMADWSTIGVSVQAAAVALAVSLADFKVTLDQHGAQLFWTTSSEHENDYFTIDKSHDGIVFNELFKVPAVGESRSLSEYHMTDTEKPAEVTYYKLSQTNMHQEKQQLSITKVNGFTSAEMQARVYPNPTTNILNLEFDANEQKEITLHLTNINGESVLKQQIKLMDGQNHLSIPMNEYPVGTYSLLMFNDYTFKQIKVVKN